MIDIHQSYVMPTGFECPTGWEMNNHRCYWREEEESVTYHEAYNTCFWSDATLISVADQAEHNFIRKM